MKKTILLSVLLASFGAIARAQTSQAVSSSKFAWDQTAPTLADAQGYTYKHYDDGSATGTAFASVSCTGTTSPYQCEAPIPAYTPGQHTMTLTASNVAGESTKSAPFAFTFVVVPGAPANIHIK